MTQVLIVGTAIPPVMGGLEVYTWELARQLARRGHRVTLFGYLSHPSSPRHETVEGIEIHRLPPNLAGNKFYGETLRRQYGFQPDDVVLLCLRRLEPKTGVQFVINLVPRLTEACPALKFLIVGDGPLRLDLQQQMRDFPQVVFAGSVPNEQVPQYIAATDFAVFASLAEATSIAALEVMACGRPLVASNVGGLPEIIADGQDGLLVPFDQGASQYQGRELPPVALAALRAAILCLAGDQARAPGDGAARPPAGRDLFQLAGLCPAAGRGLPALAQALMAGVSGWPAGAGNGIIGKLNYGKRNDN